MLCQPHHFQVNITSDWGYLKAGTRISNSDIKILVVEYTVYRKSQAKN